jgi:hypothetical protein
MAFPSRQAVDFQASSKSGLTLSVKILLLGILHAIP